MSSEWSMPNAEKASLEGFDAPKVKASKKPSAKKTKEAEKVYQQNYYEKNKKALSDAAKARWDANEGGYRDRGLERARTKRAKKRAKKASELHKRRRLRYTQGVQCLICEDVWPGVELPDECQSAECGSNEEGGPKAKLRTVYLEDKDKEWGIVRCREPIRAVIDGKPTWLHSSGEMGIRCGKSPSTMRTWIEERVIPGYSKKDHGRYWFSTELVSAVADAVRDVLKRDGRGKLDLLRECVSEQLEARGIEYEAFEAR